MDAEINLVPFIDLLSCCICFLLITAVWTEVAKIDVKPTPNMAAETPPEEPKVKLELKITSGGYYLSDGASSVDMPKVGEIYPVVDLEDKFEALRAAYPDVTTITVKAEDVVKYHLLIEVMDLCLKVGLADISVGGA